MGTRITQIPVETLVTPSTTTARITQLPVEVLVTPSTAKVRLTQFVIEVLVAESAPTTSRKYGPAIQIMG